MRPNNHHRIIAIVTERPHASRRQLVLFSARRPGSRRRQTGFQDEALLGQTMKQPAKQFALCIENTGNEVSLILGKVYRAVPDARAAKDGLVRIVDESGEDYLFDRDQFALVSFPQAVRKKLLALQKTG
jgi:hypothetical protein